MPIQPQPKPEVQAQPQPGMTQAQPGNEDAESKQDLMDIFVAQGVKLVNSIAPTIKGKASVDTLGNALFEVINKIETEGAKNGIKFPPEALIHGSSEILGHLVSQSGAQVNEDQIKAVVGIAIGRYITNGLKTGKLTGQDLVKAAEMAKQQQGAVAGQQAPAIQQQGAAGLLGGAPGGQANVS